MTSADAARSRAAPQRPRKELWGLLDQTLVSGANFLTIILVARALAPRDFGYFVLAFTLLQTAGTFQAALLTRPHNVLGAVRHGAPYADYSTTAAAAQIGFALVLAVVAAGAAGIAYAFGSSQASLVLAVVPAVAAWQLQEFGRRVLYTEGRLAAAFGTDLVSYGSYALVLLALWRFDLLTGTTALLALASALTVGAVVVGSRLRRTLAGRFDRPSLASTWHFGKWLGVAELGQWLSTHFYVYLSAAVVGAVASAALKAGQTLLGPMSVFLAFVTAYLPILYARDIAASVSLRARTRRALGTILPVVLVYCALVAVFARPVLEAVYGREYGEYADVTRLFALYYALLAFSTVAVAALSARGLTREVFSGHAVGAAVSVALGWYLLRELGPEGGVAGMLLSWTAATSLFLVALRRRPALVAGGLR